MRTRNFLSLTVFSYLYLECNCFTMLCCFLRYSSVNQPYVHIYPLPLGLPSPRPPRPIPPSRSSQSTRLTSLCKTAASHRIYAWSCTYAGPLSQVAPPSPSPSVYTILFSMSAALLLPCKQIHQYRCSSLHTYALVYDICFPLFVLLHSVQQTLGPSTFTFKEREG